MLTISKSETMENDVKTPKFYEKLFKAFVNLKSLNPTERDKISQPDFEKLCQNLRRLKNDS